MVQRIIKSCYIVILRETQIYLENLKQFIQNMVLCPNKLLAFIYFN